MLYISGNYTKMSNTGKSILLILTGLATWGAIHLIRKAKAAAELRYGLEKIQIYDFSGGNMRIKVSMWFTNIENAPLTVQNIFIDLFLNFGTEASPSLHRIATLNTNNQEFTLQANSTVHKEFFINVPLANMGIATAKILLDSFSAGHLDLPDEVILDGRIKCMGVNISINQKWPLEIVQDTTATELTE